MEEIGKNKEMEKMMMMKKKKIKKKDNVLTCA